MRHFELFVEGGTVVVKFVAATEAMSNGDGTEVLVLHRFLQTRLRLLFVTRLLKSLMQMR